MRAFAQRLMLLALTVLLTTPRLEQVWARPLEPALRSAQAVFESPDVDDDPGSAASICESCETPTAAKAHLSVLFALPVAAEWQLAAPRFGVLGETLGESGYAPDRAWIEACNRGPPAAV